jgi:hypothetical protein
MGFEFVYALGAILLLIALIWGTVHYRNHRQGERKVGDAATDRMYKQSGDPEA